MDTMPKTKKAMNKDEVMLLVELIQNNPAITTKETNAATNKLKEECWASLTTIFNSRSGHIPRQKEQLKLKWDNLKKAARKRAAHIRMNNLKTGGGKPDFIPPDEILEKVASLLGSTCSGFEVPFGGDGNGGGVIMEVDVDEMQPRKDVMEHNTDSEVANVNIPDNNILLATPKSALNSKVQDDEDRNVGSEMRSKYLYGMPTMSKSLHRKGTKKKEKQDEGREERNLAIAEYYSKKSKKLDLEIELIKSETKKNEKIAEKIDMEIEILKIESQKKRDL